MRNDPRMDLESPWGAYRARGWTGFWLNLGRRLPRGYVGSRLGLLTRRVARLGHTGPLDTTLWGQRLRLDPHGGVSEGRILFLPQFWDVEERMALVASMELAFVFADVGANVGGYTFWMASQLPPGGRVISVEPDPDLGDRLSFNIAASGLGRRVQLVRAAVSDVEGEGKLILHPQNPGENRLAEPGEPLGGESVEVPVLRLSRIVELAGVDRVDALKVDVEGGERRILEAFLTETPRAKWPGLLIVEVKGIGRGQAPLAQWLEEMGYNMATQTRLNGVFHLADTSPPTTSETSSSESAQTVRSQPLPAQGGRG